MPEYLYRCPGGVCFSQRQRMTEAGEDVSCPCGAGTARRVYTAPAVVVRAEHWSEPPDSPRYWEGIHEDPVYQSWQLGLHQTREEADAALAAMLCPVARERRVSQGLAGAQAEEASCV
jgi:putative FmdB family regulatory protein